MICNVCKTIIPNDNEGYCPDCLSPIEEEL
jgi:RNA polymerase subunit RPABC4/transcription elongation factor Spt4